MVGSLIFAMERRSSNNKCCRVIKKNCKGNKEAKKIK